MPCVHALRCEGRVLSCRELNEVATAYIDGELSTWTRMSIWLHIQMCVHCRRYFRQLRRIRAASAELPPIELPPEVARSLHEVFRRVHTEGRTDADDRST